MNDEEIGGKQNVFQALKNASYLAFYKSSNGVDFLL